jgi:hypothetical protein
VLCKGLISPRRVRSSVAVHLLLGFLGAVAGKIFEALDPQPSSFFVWHHALAARSCQFYKHSPPGFGDVLPFDHVGVHQA